MICKRGKEVPLIYNSGGNEQSEVYGKWAVDHKQWGNSKSAKRGVRGGRGWGKAYMWGRKNFQPRGSMYEYAVTYHGSILGRVLQYK